MCGIAAVLLYPQKRAEADWQALREHFTENLLFNEERGEAATGLAIVHEDGQVKLYKRSLPARAFVATEEYQRLLASLNERTTLLLGHTRHPTKGNPDNALNNHPLLAGSFCGIHNGHILNDEALFERWQLPRKGEVDSEVIFRLLDQLALKTESSRAAIALTSIVPNLKMLEGRFTFLASDRRFPRQLLVVRHDNPLSLHFSPQWQALMFSSSYLFLRKAFGRIVIGEMIGNDRALWFDAGRLPELGCLASDSLVMR